MGRPPKPLRTLRAHLRTAQQLAAAARRDPRILRDVVSGLVGRAPGKPSPTPDPAEYLPPPGLAQFDRHAHADTTVEVPPEVVGAYLTDPGRFAEWLTLHAGFRGDPPAGAHPGLTFVQQARFMGIPADVTWTVAAVDDTALELRGDGPMGTAMGFWLSVRAGGEGALVSFDAGLSGQPVEGPLGASLVRSLNDALRESLERLPAALAAAAPSTGRRTTGKPVLHNASGQMIPPNTPVLVGAGQVVARQPDPARDPATLAVRALREAAADAAAGEALLARADAVFAVACTSWQYRDLGALVATAVGASPAGTVQSTPFGGDGGQLLINEAAQAITDGEYRVVLLTGAEAGATLAAAQRAGTEVRWPEQGPQVSPTRVVGVDRPGNNDAETAVGLGAPIYLYALLESANRHRLGRGVREHARAVGELWSRFSAVAAANPNAWQPREFDAEELLTATAGNRLVSAPYTKLLCANLQVDMASGLILCSAAAATEAGIPQEKWVFVHAGASGHDEWFATERAELTASPAIRTLGSSVLEHTGITIDDVAHADLYACFPSAVQIAARELGLPVDDPQRPLTLTGGLTFGGGPGNNYGSHAVATMVRRLREQPETYGLTTSLGWYVTKHAIGVYSAMPPARPYAHLRPIIEHPPSRPVRVGHDGPAIVEAYTVPFGRDNQPEAAILSLLTPDGARVLVRTEEPDIVGELVDGDAVGLPVTVSGTEIALSATEPVALPAPPPAPVIVERRAPVTVITLNRPEVRNAVNLAMATAIERALDAFEADPHAQVAVITGAGGFFSAGMDLKAAARGEVPMTEHRGPLGITGKPPRKPLIAAVEGPALAGGCEIALTADLIVAASDAQFGIPEPKRGLVAAGGGVYRLRERLPRNIAMQLALTGNPMPATRLAEFGLVNVLAEPGRALDAALELAAEIAVNAPLSLTASKQIIDETTDWTTADAFARQNEIASTALFSEDAGEGVRAFAEKRAPVWRGR
ncbi:crotonase/enoyl-CoA hydratase family protein [Amycolatopsis sp. NPDC058986]|uniref:type II toxin-antitoxin system Rv0910 family toxin n=1 Tax=unclassified Amycolatopsis TaxID=2618356 RepID=UPI003670AC94